MLKEILLSIFGDGGETVGLPTVLDLGVGDGRQALALSCTGVVSNVTGFDISWHIVHHLKTQLNVTRHDCLERGPLYVYWYDGFELPEMVKDQGYDVAISMQVVFHLLEDALYERYMDILFSFARHVVIIHAPDSQTQLPAAAHEHMRYRIFSNWVAKLHPEWILHHKVSIPSKFGFDSCDGIHIFVRR